VQEIHADHWRMLRLAKLRGLQVKRLNASLYAVSSYTRPGRWYRVTLESCECPATDYCSHMAIAFDRHSLDSDSAHTRLEYAAAQREDFAETLKRQLRRELSSDDRRFIKPHIERVRARYEIERPEPREYAIDF
jgi:hypothetical protein